MTPDEVTRLLDKVLVNADRGCPTCISELLADFAETFPEHRKQVFKWAASAEVAGVLDDDRLAETLKACVKNREWQRSDEGRAVLGET